MKGPRVNGRYVFVMDCTMEILSTVQVARELGVRPDRINRAIWLGELKPPIKGPGGSFLWEHDDIERLKMLLSRKATIAGGRQ
jgi:hypothetical protein